MTVLGRKGKGRNWLAGGGRGRASVWDNRNYGFHSDQKIASVRPGSVKGEANEDGRRRGDGKRKEGKRFDGGGGGRKKM